MNMAKKKITRVEDVKGLRIRHAGKIFAQVIQQLGGTPVAVQPAASADALAKGIVDGAMFPYEAALAFKLGTVCKYVIEPGWSAATFSLMMNPAKYASLPADLRKLIDDTTGPEAAARIGAAFEKADIAGKTYMQQHAEIVVIKGKELERFQTLVAPVTERFLKELEGKGLPARAVYARFKKLAAQ
jgi:TRAP-type C4-dicarboxylate transport system substrate-binding protein